MNDDIYLAPLPGPGPNGLVEDIYNALPGSVQGSVQGAIDQAKAQIRAEAAAGAEAAVKPYVQTSIGLSGIAIALSLFALWRSRK